MNTQTHKHTLMHTHSHAHTHSYTNILMHTQRNVSSFAYAAIFWLFLLLEFAVFVFAWLKTISYKAIFILQRTLTSFIISVLFSSDICQTIALNIQRHSHRLGIVVHTSNPSTWDAEAGGLQFEARLGYTGISHLKQPTKQKDSRGNEGKNECW